MTKHSTNVEDTPKDLSARRAMCSAISPLRGLLQAIPRTVVALGLGRSVAHVDELDARLARITRHRFRARFHVRGRDRAIVDLRGMPTVRKHAADLIGKRLAPAQPDKDGRQTPYRGHPVFVAQHATATCCRTCLEKWHGIPKGRELEQAERDYVVEAICRWLEADIAGGWR